MKFDRWWDSETSGHDQGGVAELTMCPNGKNAGEITKVDVKDKKFKQTMKNPDGTCLVLIVSVPGCQPVEALVPVDWRGMVEAVCRAAAITPPNGADDWDERQLVGRQVVIETVQGIGKNGREYVGIEKWHRGPDPLPEEIKKRSPARSQTAKAAQAFTEGDPDAIPF